MKTFTVTDADAIVLAELLRENAEYRPDYFGTLATAVLGQLKDDRQSWALHRVRVELFVGFDGSPGDARREQWRERIGGNE